MAIVQHFTSHVDFVALLVINNCNCYTGPFIKSVTQNHSNVCVFFCNKKKDIRTTFLKCLIRSAPQNVR